MSGHPRDKYPGGSGPPPGNKAAAPPPKQRGRELRADFLLNFQRPPAHQRPQQAYAPPPRRSRPSGRQYQPVAFTKGRFVQSAFRLYVDRDTPDVAEATVDADALVRWESVRQVDLLCEQPPKCPICLEVDMTVPRITKCGHVFCAPCVMRYFITLTDYNGKKYQRCPVCNEQVCPDELTPARFEESKALRENDRASFILAHRDVSSTVVRLSPAAAAGAQSPPLAEDESRAGPAPASPAAGRGGDSLRLPSRGEPGWHFSRLLRLRPGEAARLLEYELEALRSLRTVASAEGESEILPSIDAALALTRKQRERSGSSPGFADAGGDGVAAEDLLLPAPAVDLPEEADEGAASVPQPDEADDPGSSATASGNPPCPGSSSVTSPLAGSVPSSPAPGPSSSLTLSPGLSSSSPVAGGGGGGRPHLISFYQAADGRLAFLEPFFTRLLLQEHGGRWDGLPPVLENLRLERLQEITVSEEMRRRHKFLQHLPLGAVVSLAEVDLRNHLGQETKNLFAEEFTRRRQQRKKEQMRSRKEERIGKSRAAEEEERYYQALNLTHPATVQQLPTAEDFAATLPGREAAAPAEPAVEGEGGAVDGAEGAAAAGEAGGEASDGSEDAGPTLADKIKGKMAAKARPRDPARSFPELGGGSGAGARGSEAAGGGRGSGAGASSSAWGPGRGSDRVKKDSQEEGAEAGAASSGGPADEQPTLGQALEAALRSAEAEQPGSEGAAGAAAGGSKKKKGRAGKATTIRLFG